MAKRKAKNSNLTRAKKAKNDEFYTQATDIEHELKYYADKFKGKIVYCNCDDPTYSEFWRYFHLKFHFLGLKELISTHYDEGKPTYALFYRGGKSEQDDSDFNSYDEKKDLKQDGDFRSEESIELLKRCDIVVTNPPFSLYRNYVAQLMKYKKKFIIIGNKNSITYKEIFPLLMYDKMWEGVNNVHNFKQPNGSIKKMGNVGWFTNIPVNKPTDRVILFKQFNLDNFPVYDNYAAFNVDKVVNIPIDYQITVTLPLDRLVGFQKTYGDDLQVLSQNENTVTMQITRPIWGVPITFMDKYNPSKTIDAVERERERERERAIWQADSESSAWTDTQYQRRSSSADEQQSTANQCMPEYSSDNLANKFYILGTEIQLNISKGRGYINGKRMYSRIFIQAR